MQRSYFLVLFILLYRNTLGQERISGKIYGEKSVLKYVKLTNRTQGLVQQSNEEGDFTIAARQNDSIVFSTAFYNDFILKVDSSHLKEAFVVELKRVTNKLDEVVIRAEAKEYEIDEKEFNASFANSIKEDIEKNPHKYGIYRNGNILNGIAMLINLFRKKKAIEKPIVSITYQEFEKLFLDDDVFNEALLRNELKIAPGFESLFFDFCDAKQIDSQILKDKNDFLLIDILINISVEFHTLIATYNGEFDKD